MKYLVSIILISSFMFSSCEKTEITNARVAGSYNCFVKAQTDYWFVPLAINYVNDEEIDAYGMWDGENDAQEVRITITKKGNKIIRFDIEEQTYEGDKTIKGDGILHNNTIEFYYILGSKNFNKSYVLTGNK